MIRFLSFILIFLLLVAGACSSRKNKLEGKDLIPEKELIPLLTDIYIANGLLSIPKINSQYLSFDSVSTYYQVIEKYGYTTEMMDNTMKYYYIKNPKRLNKIYDQVLGIISEMDSRIEKEALIEQLRKSNLWTAEDFYAEPSSVCDSTRFDIKLSNPGYYSLSFSATLYSDDQSANPLAMIYSISPDSLETGTGKLYQSPIYLKDGRTHNYLLTIKIAEPRQLRGWLLNSEYIQHVQMKHYRFEDISLTFSPQPL